MNRIYRLIWNARHGAYEPSAETARGRRKRSGGRRSLLVGSLVAGTLTATAHGAPQLTSVAPSALPTSPTVTTGQASVTSKGSQMVVNESTTKAAINWGSFDIGSAASVTFVQPTSTSVVLNRSLSADPSQIYGKLSANGYVFIVNPQGVVVGNGAEVNVGGFVASSLNLSDQDLMGGHYSFKGPGSSGAVSNAGSINVAPGGFAALIGPQVTNTGAISAKLGSVALASGSAVTLDFDDTGMVKVAVDQAALNAMVQNSGAVVADGGRIVLTAKSANDVLGSVVNNTGVLQSQSLGLKNGQIWLLASDPVANTGANGAAANANQVQGAAGGITSSGTIDVSGNGGQVTLAGTTVDVSGVIKAGSTTGNAGSVLINSTQSSTLEAGSTIDVSSGGAAGKVVVWSDGDTSAAGSIQGRGTGASGTGATVEVSAAHDLAFNAAVQVDADKSTQSGTLILDPATLEIAAGSGSGSSNIVYQSTLQAQSGNIVLSATGQITVDALTNNVLNLANNATGLSITSESSGGIAFLNNGSGVPSGITTHGAPVTLTASGSGSLDNIGTITTQGGDISLSGVYVHLAGGLDATNGQSPAGNVAVSVFGGGLLSSSTSPIAGAQVLLDGTYGYVGASGAAIPTATSNLTVKTGGNAYVADADALTTLALSSNHLEGTAVGIDITAPNLTLTGADGTGDGTTYSGAVRWTQYSASNPSASLAGPTSVSITEDGNLLPGNINLPQTALALTSSQEYILGGNTQPVTANTLTLSSPLGIGGTDFNGINGETDEDNPGAAGGASLLIQAGTVTANVISPSGSVTGIVNLTQQGNLVGSVQAQDALLQATGNIGSGSQNFTVALADGGEMYNVAAGGNVDLAAAFNTNATFANVQAGGTVSVQATAAGGSWYQGAVFGTVSAGGNLTLTGVNNELMQVTQATSTNGSIAISNDYALAVYGATLLGTDSPSRSITVNSNYSDVIFGSLSTNGVPTAAASAAPLGTITITAPEGTIYDRAAGNDEWETDYGNGQSILRAGNASLSAYYDFYFYNTAVDTYTNLSMIAGSPGTYTGRIEVTLTGIDSVNDPTGISPHSIHIANATAYYGENEISNQNGGFSVGTIRSYYDYGGGDSDAGSINLSTTGSIVPDGSVGGGRIDASNLDGQYGDINIQAGGGLGQRGTGAGGTTGAGYLSLSGSSLNLTSGGDLFVLNDQDYISLTLNLNYASSPAGLFYHFNSSTAADTQAGTPAIDFNGSSSGGLLTETTGSMNDNGNYFSLNTDGSLRIESFQAGQGSNLNIYSGADITVDAPANNTPALAMADSTNLYIDASGSLSIGNLASIGNSAGNNSVGLEADGGNMVLGQLNAPLANVTLYAYAGDIVAAGAGNRTLAGNLSVYNTYGAFGADPTVSGSVPITVGVSGDLSINNQGSGATGGGSINLVTLNDPASLQLVLFTPNSSTYGAHFSIAPSTTGLGLTGSADPTGMTLATLGTTGSNPAAVPVSITADTPNMTINSGAGPQLGIGYTLTFGTSYPTVVANLSGSTGQDVVLDVNNSNGSAKTITGDLSLTNLVINDQSYSYGGSPLDLSFTLGQALSAFQLTRSGSDNDPASFNGGSVTLTGSGQTISTLESTGAHGAAPSALTVNATSASALNLEVDLQESGSINVGTIAIGTGAVTLDAHSGIGSGSNGFTPYSTAILGTTSSNSITAGNVTLSATNNNAGQATIGTSATPLNINAGTADFTTSGNLYATTGSALSNLSVTASHPNWVSAANTNTYQITGSTALSASDTASSFTTTLASMTSSSPVNFSFTTDAALAIGTLNAGSSSTVSLASTGTFNGNGNYPAIGISQSSGTITAGTVNLTSTGYQGYVGTSGSAISVATPNLDVTSDGSVYLADTASLTSLTLALGHSNSYTLGYVPNNTYSLSAPNISSLSIIDNNNNGNCCSPNIQLASLVSTTLQSFSMTTTDTNLVVGTYDGTPFSGQVNLSSAATVDLTSHYSIWAAGSNSAPGLSDQASGAVADDTVAVKTGTLNLNAENGNVAFSWSTCCGQPAAAIPIEVTNLTVNASGSAYLTNVGNLNVTSATIGGSGYFRAVEPSAGTEASITGGTQANPISASDLTLVAMYGDIGSSSTSVVTSTTNLTLQSGANINATSEQELAYLSILSDHNKGSVSDTSNGGLNSISVTDQGTNPLELGATDLGVGGGGYQMTGMNAPQLDFSFETDTSISVGSLTAQTIALQSDGGSILHIPSGGTITANSVGLTAATAGQSVGATGQNILVNSPSLVVYTGGNMYVADSATLDSFGLTIGAVGDLGSTPVYHLDNSAAAAPLTFIASADLVNNTLDLNSIATSRTDAPVSIDVHSYGSSIAAGTIASNQGTVSLESNSGSIYGLSGSGINASEVDLTSWGGNVGANQSGTSAPVAVTASTVNVLTDGSLQLTSGHTIDTLSVTQYNGALASGTTWSVTTPDFNLAGTADSSHEIDLTSVTGATTDLSVVSITDILVGTLNLGSANLSLSSYQNNGISITSDGTAGSNPNITTTGDVTLAGRTGVGASGTAVTTDIGGSLNVTTSSGVINIDQISATPLVVSNLSTDLGDGSLVHIVGQGSLEFTGGFGTGGGPVTLSAGGDIDFSGIGMSGGVLTIAAGGSINGGNIGDVTSATLTASGVASGSPGTLTVGSINGVFWQAAPGAIQLTALGDINLGGDIESAASVSVTSTGGSIYSQSGNNFGATPTVTLSAAGDIGSGSAGDVGALVLNGTYNESPSSLALSATGGGVVDLTSYAPVVASTLHGGGDVGLYVVGTVWTSGADLQFGSVSSTSGVVTLNTYGGNITAINGSSTITAGTGINLIEQENPYIYGTSTPTDAVYSLGSSSAPLQLSAPQIGLTSNGDIYATLPSTGVTSLYVARTYIGNTNVSQTDDMPSSTVAIGDGTSTDVLDVTDGGWATGGKSVISANYGTALNLGYAGNNAIQLGTIDLNGGSLALQATSPSDVSITSSGGLIQANELSFNLNAIGTATGGFGTSSSPINTEIVSLSGSTVGATAGVFMDQTGPITLANLSTGGDISVTTTRVSGPTANADISIGNVSSGGSVHLDADGAINLASNVSSPNISAGGGSGDGDVSLTAAAGIDLPGISIGSNHSNVTLTATAGDIDLSGGTNNAYLYAANNLDIDAQAGGVSVINGSLNASGALTVHAGATGIDVTNGSITAAGPIQLTADLGDIDIGSINSYGGAGSVTLTATTGAIEGTTPTQLNPTPPNGINSNGDITLTAATGIGTAALPITVIENNGSATINATTTGAGDINLVTGQSGSGSATLDVNSGGALTVQNYYQDLTLDNVQSVNDMHVTEENYYGQLVLNNVAATGPGSVITVVAPYGDISSENTSGVVSASRIVLNALGDSSGGTLGQSDSPVNVNADVVIAVASGNISLNSVATGTSKMPLVASNGLTPTISITSAGDFQVGQIVAGQQGEVDINSTGNIYDDGDSTTRIYAGTVNLTATGAIGTSVDPLQLTAVTYDNTGAVTPGNVSAASTQAGSIYLTQQGNVDLTSLTTANGSINVAIQGQPSGSGMSTLTLADSSATDAAGNDVNIVLSQGDLTVDQAIAGMTAGTVDINAQAGSIYGDGRSNCCTVPNASANTVDLHASANVGTVTDLATLAGVAFGIQANQSDVISGASTGGQINLQYVGNATVGTASSAAPNIVNVLGLNPEVILQACNTLTIDGLSLGGAGVGLNAGTAGSGGSVVDGITGGATASQPDVTAATLVVGAGTNVGDPAAALWVNASSISANASNGGVWINSVATTPVTLPSITAGNGPVVINGAGNVLADSVTATSGTVDILTQGNLGVGSINAGTNDVTLTSATGAVQDGVSGGSSLSQPNVVGGTVTVNSAGNSGGASDALWVNASTINADATNGGVWINSAATTPVTLASITAGNGAVGITGQGDLLVESVTATNSPVSIAGQGNVLVQSVNAGTGAVTLTSATAAVQDGISGGSSITQPNVVGGTVTVNSATNAGDSSDTLWVNASTINADAAGGGVWINSAATTPVTLGSVVAGNGPVTINGQGNMLASSVTAANGPVALTTQGTLGIGSINAGTNDVTLTSATGAVQDGVSGGSSSSQPNVVGGTVTVNSAGNSGGASDALWVNASTINADAAGGGVWINSAATTPVTLASIVAGNGPVAIAGQGALTVESVTASNSPISITGQGNVVVDSVNAGTGDVTLSSTAGAVQDGISGGSSISQPNVVGGTVTVNSGTNSGNSTDALWVNASTINADANNGGVWINSAATTPVTLGSIVAGNGPLTITSQGDLVADSVTGANGPISITSPGNMTVESVTASNAPVAIVSQGTLLVDLINAGTSDVTLTSATSAVQDGVSGGSSSSHPNVVAGTVTVNSSTDAGGSSDALWVNASTINADAAGGGVWINSAATTPVTLASIVAGNGPVAITGQGALAVDSVTAANSPISITGQGNVLVESVNAGTGDVTLSSTAGAVQDGISGGSSLSQPNVVGGTVTVNSGTNSGNSTDALWVNASTINSDASNGGVWINSASTTPVTVGSVIAGHGPVVINSQGDMLVDLVNAGTSAVQLVSANGGVLDGTGSSSASNPNVISGALSVGSGSDAGNASDALWVNSTSISAAANTGGIWINSASTKTVTLTSLLTNGGAIVINGQGDLKLVSINAATGDVTLTSVTGSLLDGIKGSITADNPTGGSTVNNPNVIGANVTLSAAKAIGNIADPIWVQGVFTYTAGTGHWINVPPVLTPYQWLPLVQGVSPVTVYAANSQAQRQSPQDLPITLIGQPAPQANPIDVSVNSLGIELPDGVAPYAVEQDSTQGTSSQPILGGNDTELGRKKSLARMKKKGLRQSKRNSDQPNSRQG